MSSGARKWMKLAVVAALLLAIAGGLTFFAPGMAIVQPGTAAQFWYCQCSVELERGAESRHGHLVIRRPRDGTYLYYEQGFHRAFLYGVPAADVMAAFPAVCKRFETMAASRAGRETFGLESYQRWLKEDGGRTGAEGLMSVANADYEDRLRRNWASVSEPFDMEHYVEAVWPYVQRYPLCIAFEFCYLSAVALFTLWPWLRGLGPWRWALHAGLLPVLLYLPSAMGYAQWSYTSVGPSGGVLYPWIIVWFRMLPGIYTPFAETIWVMMPKPLTWLSPSLGPCLSLSGGFPSLSAIVLLGCLFGAVAVLLRPPFITRFLRRAQTGRPTQDAQQSLAKTAKFPACSRRHVILAIAAVALGACLLFPAARLIECRMSVLLWAIDGDQTQRVKSILSVRQDLATARTDDGLTALHYAVSQGPALADMLLAAGADANAQDVYGAGPLHRAARSGRLPVVELLLSRGARLAMPDHHGNTPLHYAAADGSESVVAGLLERGADVNARNADGDTPLHMCSDAKISRVLIDHHADVNARDRWSDTPLHKVLRGAYGSTREEALLLLEKGADVNARSKDGLTPLHVAARSNEVATVRLLCERGADVNARSENGDTPLSIALRRQDSGEIVACLRHHGAGRQPPLGDEPPSAVPAH